jgi:putative ABC transport system substrate-binding protein
VINIAPIRRSVFSRSIFVTALVALGVFSGTASSQERLPRLGILAISGEESSRAYDATFFQKLESLGWVEGKNVDFVFATAHNDPSRYPQAVARLLQENVDVIYADSAPALRAAHAATRTIPIVASDYTADPVAAGYATSHGRPGGNVTGIFLDAPQFAGKWIELLQRTVPQLSRAAVLWDPSPGDVHLRALQAIASPFELQLQVVEVHKPEDIDTAKSALRGKPQGLFILPSPMMFIESKRLARLAIELRLPAISMAQQFTDHGGLLAYGPDQDSANERVAVLVTKILGGTKSGDLPIEAPTKFELVVNLKTAKALGLAIPDAIVTQADRVIH